MSPIFSSLYGTRLDRELGTDDATVLFTTARRKAAINEGQEEFAELTECFLRQETVPITGGTAEYDLNAVIAALHPPGDYVRLSKEQVQFRYVDASSNVTVTAGDDLVRRDVEWLNRYEPGWQNSTVSTATGMQIPYLYYERMADGARYLGFYPTPSTGSSASATAIVPYVARPGAMTSDTNEPYQVVGNVRTDLRIYHQALVHYAAHQLEKLRRDEQASDRQLQKFLSYVTRFLTNKRVKGGKTVTFGKDYLNAGRGVRAEDPRR